MASPPLATTADASKEPIGSLVPGDPAVETNSPSTTVTTSPPPPSANDPVTMLQAAFPSMDRTIISEVLTAHGGDLDATSVALLEMNNPSARDAESLASENASKTAQMISDEAYARELMNQMEREHQAAYGRPLGTAPGNGQQQTNEYTNLNYVPRQRGAHSGARSQQTPEHETDSRPRGQDELDQLAEQFGKFADTGKKTFNTFLSKAKDKVAELQQQRAAQAQQQALSSPSSGLDSASPPPDSVKAPSTAPTTIAGFTIPSIPAPWGNTLANLGGKKATSPRDDVRSDSTTTRESVMKDYLNLGGTKPTTAQSIPGGASSEERSKPLPALSPSPPPKAPSPVYSTSPTPTPIQYSSSPSGRIPLATSPAKVQMLPRQPISLLDNNSTATRRESTISTGATKPQNLTRKTVDEDDEEDDSDVEYVRNPFNEDD